MNSYQKRTRAQGADAIVGVDAGKSQHALVVRPRGGADSEPFMIDTTRAGFEEADGRIMALAPGACRERTLVGIEFAGNYGFTFAHYLDQRGYQVVNILGSSSKRWKEVVHIQRLKTDPKDAVTITDLTSQGHFVGFPFLQPIYADLRYLASHRRRLTVLRSASIARLKGILQVTWPEFERQFKHFNKKTPLALLDAYPSPGSLLGAPRAAVLRLMKRESRNHLGIEAYELLRRGAEGTIGLPGAEAVLKDLVPLELDLLRSYERQLADVEARMAEHVARTPEAEALLSIPKMGPITAAVFLGSISDPQAYDSSRQILRVAGLSLYEQSSGAKKGQQRISKRGRPQLRRAAYLFALRSVRSGGIYRAEYQRHLASNGGIGKKALVAVSRKALCMMFAVAKDRRLYTPEPPK